MGFYKAHVINGWRNDISHRFTRIHAVTEQHILLLGSVCFALVVCEKHSDLTKAGKASQKPHVYTKVYTNYVGTIILHFLYKPPGSHYSHTYLGILDSCGTWLGPRKPCLSTTHRPVGHLPRVEEGRATRALRPLFHRVLSGSEGMETGELRCPC